RRDTEKTKTGEKKMQRHSPTIREPQQYLFIFLSSLCLCVSAVQTSSGQTSFPMITHAYPVAAQRGKATEVVVEGQMNFAGCYKALFEGQGVTAEIVTLPNPPAQT